MSDSMAINRFELFRSLEQFLILLWKHEWEDVNMAETFFFFYIHTTLFFFISFLHIEDWVTSLTDYR